MRKPIKAFLLILCVQAFHIAQAGAYYIPSYMIGADYDGISDYGRITTDKRYFKILTSRTTLAHQQMVIARAGARYCFGGRGMKLFRVEEDFSRQRIPADSGKTYIPVKVLCFSSASIFNKYFQFDYDSLNNAFTPPYNPAWSSARYYREIIYAASLVCKNRNKKYIGHAYNYYAQKFVARCTGL